MISFVPVISTCMSVMCHVSMTTVTMQESLDFSFRCNMQLIHFGICGCSGIHFIMNQGRCVE